VANALDAGNSQEAVARACQVSQPTVSRTARQILAGAAVDAVTPTEVILRHVAGETEAAEMLDELLGFEFTAGAFDPTQGDGYIAGSWDEVVSAKTRGLLTDEQYNLLATKARIREL